MTVDTKALRQIAEQATPGPYKARDYKNPDGGIWIDCAAYANKGKGRCLGGTLATVNPFGHGKGSVEANAEFIATANPQTVIALLDVVEAAKDLREKLRGSNGVSLEGRAKTITRVLEAFGAFDQAIAALEGE